MATLPSFDDIGEESREFSDYKPFQFREEKDDEGTLKWLNENFHSCYMGSRERLMSYRRFSNRYKNAGNSVAPGFIKDSNRDSESVNTKPKVRTNFYYSYVEQKVSQVSRQKQNPVFIPLNDTEMEDINNAEACNMLVKFRAKQLNMEQLMREQDRKTFKYGMSFAKIYWDTCAGPVNPTYEKLSKKYGEIPRADKKGKITKHDARLGDVVVKIIPTDCFFPERKKTLFEDLDFCEEVEFMNIDQVKAEYPNKEIKKEDYYWLDVDNKGYNQDDIIMVHHFYHRPTKWLPHGCYIKYIETQVLEWIEDESLKDIMPDDELPFVPDIDVEVDDEFWGRPFLINIEQLNNLHDLIQSGIARNIGVASHPKILAPEGSVNLKQLNNEYGVVQYRGAVAPQWMQHNYVNRGEFDIQDRLEKKMDLLAGIYGVSKGDVPQGITAFSAIRYLDDQEVQRNSNTIAKRRERITKIYMKMMKMMSQHYKPDDGRMVRILGENNEYLVKSFAKFDFNKIYGVEIENVSALSDTRSGRVSDIIDLNAANQKDPVFGKKEITKLLDLGLEKGFVEEVSYAPVTARTILEQLKNGEKPLPPEETDDLIEMWQIFSRFVESLMYKQKLDKRAKQNIKDYITAVEYLMDVKAKKNAFFAQKVRMFDKFPMFFVPAAILTAQPAQATMPTGGAQANQGLNNMNKKAQNEMQPDGGEA